MMEFVASETGPAPSRQQNANTVQCVADAIEGVFQWIQAHPFAKSSPDTRTYLVRIHPTVPTRKQPKDMAKLKKAPTKETLKATVEVKSSTKAGSVARDGSEIEPAKGKLGVMFPAVWAVDTTLFAYVEPGRRADAKP